MGIIKVNVDKETLLKLHSLFDNEDNYEYEDPNTSIRVAGSDVYVLNGCDIKKALEELCDGIKIYNVDECQYKMLIQLLERESYNHFHNHFSHHDYYNCSKFDVMVAVQDDEYIFVSTSGFDEIFDKVCRK